MLQKRNFEKKEIEKANMNKGIDFKKEEIKHASLTI